jgi:uncharacterized membrane protein YedE/YeeE
MSLPDIATIESAALGGALIGAAAAGLLLVDGYIAGVSGILGDAVRLRGGLWPWAFVAGLVAAPFVAPFVGIPSVVPTYQAGLIGLGLAGVLVGFGTRLSGGCTSGHGVCGISNLSPRSITATVIFMIVAAATVFVVRHGHISLPKV